MMAKSHVAETPALASAITSIEGESKVLLQPDWPIDTDTRGQRVAGNTGLHENGTSTAAVNTLPGADQELQSLLQDSPFLDLSSPMTPYEWVKCVVMVSGCSILANAIPVDLWRQHNLLAGQPQSVLHVLGIHSCDFT